MDSPNQVPPPHPDETIVVPEPRLQRLPANLLPWLIAVGLAGIAGLLLNQAELALFTALAGLFVAAHAADLDPERELFYRLLAWVVPVGSTVVFAFLGLWLLFGDFMMPGSGTPPPGGWTRYAGAAVAMAGALWSAAMAHPAVAGAVGRWWFRSPMTSHVLRLATRMSLLGMLLYVPAAVMFGGLIDDLVRADQSLLGPGSLWGNLVGLSLLALGGVGYRVSRDGRDTLERLGLTPLTPPQWAVIGLGVVVLMILNGGSEWVQKTWLPGLWERDQKVTELITRGLTFPDALLLGISAGVGEELAIRGALQPRLGIARSSALFALLHVQYSWFGVLVIFLLGLLLGVIRQRTSTTVAIAVHTIYDILAVFQVRS